MTSTPLDCLVIGYYEPPFEQYEALIANYGRQSTAYRDLRFSFVDVDGVKLNYVDLLNHVYLKSHPDASANRGRKEMFVSGEIPNLAAVYLTSYLKRRGYRADYVNLFEYERRELAGHLARDPMCVAITTTFYVLPLPVIEIVNVIRDLRPDVKIVVGGPLIGNYFRALKPRPAAKIISAGALAANSQSATAYEPPSSSDLEVIESICEDIGADIYVNESQGEATLARIIQCLKQKGPLDQVPNIAYFAGRSFRITHLEPENNSLDENTVQWSDYPPERLGRTIQTRTARSCAFNCSFCNYPTRAGRLTLAGLAAVKKELDSIREVGNVQNVVFIDDTFNVPLQRFKDICRLMIAERYGFNWYSYFRCSNSDSEAIDLMAESGCKGVFLGIESGSPRILVNMNKAATIEKYAAGIKMLHERDILTFGSFIVGFPGETTDTIRQTSDFIAANALDYYRAQLWYCEPGTPIHGQRDKYQIEGEGFVWSHQSLTSTQAMDQIEDMFLRTETSRWLPQWSFDFWIIPYLLGRGLTRDQFKDFMVAANELLSLEIRGMTGGAKTRMQAQAMSSLTQSADAWRIDDSGSAATRPAAGNRLSDSIHERCTAS